MTTARPHPAWASTHFSLPELMHNLDVRLDGAQSLELDSLATAHGGILGAQLLGQSVAAAESATPDKSVLRLSMSFLRPSRWDAPVRLTLRHLGNGRRFAVVELDFEQAGRLVARGEALLSPVLDEKHAVEDDAFVGLPTARALWPWDAAVPVDPAETGRGSVWARIPVDSLTPRAGRALLAFATEPLTVPLVIDQHGMRERGGEIPQAVLMHSIAFCSSFDARLWHLHRPEVVGRQGEVVTGRGTVLDGAGRQVAVTKTIASVGL